METQTFRILFWQRLMPLLSLPVFAGFLSISPISDGWGRTQWVAAATVVGLGIAAYAGSLWRKSAVTLDCDGLTLYLGSSLATWPWEKLLKVKQIGRFRVKMCFDPDVPGKHYHISIDLIDSDAFADAVLDWYAHAQGRELPELEEEAA